MIPLLSQVPAAPPAVPTLPDVDPSILDTLQRLADSARAFRLPPIPTLPQALEHAENLPVLIGVGLCLVGLVYLLLGWKRYHLLMMANAGVAVALLAGSYAVQTGYSAYWHWAMLGGFAIGFLITWPLVRVFVALLGAITGGSVGYLLFQGIAKSLGRGEWMGLSWIGGVIGAILLALVAIKIFQLSVMILTTLQGSTLMIAGTLIIVLKFDEARSFARAHILGDPLFLPSLIGGVFLVGLLIQFVGLGKHKKKKQQEEVDAKEQTHRETEA